MRRVAVFTALLSLLAGACAGTTTESATTTTIEVVASSDAAPTSTEVAETTTSTEPDGAFEFTTVTSDDGGLVVQVPTGVNADISIDVLDPAAWPAPLADAEQAGGVTIYDLEPSGSTFAEPVRVSKRFDVDTFAELELGPRDVPLVTLLTTDADGRYELLNDLTITRSGSAVWVSGTTDHFSPLLSSNEGVAIRVTPSTESVGLLADVLPASHVDAIGELLSGPTVAVLDDLTLYNAPLTAEQIGALGVDFAESEDLVSTVMSADGPVELAESGPDEATDWLAFDTGNPYDEDLASPQTNEITLGRDREIVSNILAGARFRHRSSRVSIGAMPSTSSLLTYQPLDEGLIPAPYLDQVDVRVGALVVTLTGDLATAEPPTTTGEVPTSQRDPAADQLEALIADCHMYLEMYPELSELNPELPILCESDPVSARNIISGLLTELLGAENF